MLAHELRNPLAAISNAIQLLPPNQLQETQSWARGVIERQIKQLGRLIDDLLDISRISRGKFELKKETVEFQPILSRTLETIQPLFDEKRHTFKNFSSPRPFRLHADPVRLEQMLGNLLINAAKYTDPGGRIELSAEAEKGEIVIRVTDTGIGLSKEMLGRIFEMFTQDPDSAGRSHGGLGLGLAFVRILAEMHGGSISAESEGPNQGSTFTLRLPILSEPENNSASSGKAAFSDQAPLIETGSKRVLVVDDNIDTAQSLAQLLTKLGYDVQTAYDGLSALATARTYRPDIMLLDLGLPGMDGYQVARELRQDDCFRETNLRLIAISGYGQAQDRHRSTAAGFDHHFLKPVKLEQLLSMLNEG
jgi:CheY-like chemotaxis protein